MKRNRILVSVLHLFNWDVTMECVRALSAQVNVDIDIYLLNNGNNPLPRKYETELQTIRSVRYSSLPENCGFSKGHNMNLEFAKRDGKQYEYVAFVNNDTTCGPKTLCELVRILDKNPDIGTVHPVTYYRNGSTIWCYGVTLREVLGIVTLDRKNSTIRSSDPFLKFTTATSGAFLVMRYRDYEQSGGFPNEYFAYCEDIALSLRVTLLRQLHAFVNSKQTAVLHDVSLGAKNGYAKKGFSPTQAYLRARNSILLAKELPGVRRWTYFFARLLIGQAIEVFFLRSIRSVRAYAHGVIDGLTNAPVNKTWLP